MALNLFQYFVLFVLLLSLMVACTERIHIDLEAGDVQLVVEGYLFEGDSVSWIRLTKTSGYFSNRSPVAVSSAEIDVVTPEATVRFSEREERPGYYMAPGLMHLDSGEVYQLLIDLKEAVGGYSHYEAITAFPGVSATIDSISMDYIFPFNRWLVRFYGKDNPTRDYYLFNSMVNGELITDTLSRKRIADDNLFNGNYINGLAVQFLYGDELFPGDSYTLVLSNITEEYFKYIQSAFDEMGPHDPLFSGPPANLPGNISHDALGFFTAFALVKATTTVPEQHSNSLVKPNDR